MEADLRQLLTFACEGETLAASLDNAAGPTGVLMVIGGTQVRVGAHRMYERLAFALAKSGTPCFRYDRRGVGDSSGEDQGYRRSGPELTAAAAAFRAHCPGMAHIVGFGLCDGATSLALFGEAARLDAIVLANPWLVEAEAGSPPPAAIKRHYRDRLLSLDGWKQILRGDVDLKKLLGGLRRIAAPSAPSSLAEEVAASLRRAPPATALLATRDATAIAAEAEWKQPCFQGLMSEVLRIDSDSHTFARPGDDGKLYQAVKAALDRFSASRA